MHLFQYCNNLHTPPSNPPAAKCQPHLSSSAVQLSSFTNRRPPLPSPNQQLHPSLLLPFLCNSVVKVFLIFFSIPIILGQRFLDHLILTPDYNLPRTFQRAWTRKHQMVNWFVLVWTKNQPWLCKCCANVGNNQEPTMVVQMMVTSKNQPLWGKRW